MNEFDHAPGQDVIAVSALNRLARFALERALPIRWVAGEIANLTRAPSGHWYFTLKDSHASVRCAMFRNRNQFLDWRPENGMQVEVKAQATLYEARGEFQLSIEALRRAGLGALFEAFARLKAKLEAEGLFAAARKRPLPAYPRRIGIVTSARAAALRDVLVTLRRRWPVAALVLYPTLVQGPGAAAQIAAALGRAGMRAECDVLLLVRGGGGIEDLWAFNEESVARAIAACPIPVVSGIGHETDVTIADFVADLRAPTPTGAAQLATPDGAELARRLAQAGGHLARATRRRLESASQRLDHALRRLPHPARRIAARRERLEATRRRLRLALAQGMRRDRQRQAALAARLERARPRPARLRHGLDGLRRRLALAWRHGQARQGQRVDALLARYAHLNPEAVLARGYSLTRRLDGRLVRAADELRAGEAVRIEFAAGAAAARIEDIDP
jgi:exodeoxyribonuclease VII large subunit